MGAGFSLPRQLAISSSTPLDIGNLYAAAAARQPHTSTVISAAPTNGPSREAVN
jgi:hypothetical protein